jgi:hypothetical protein
LGRGSAGCRQIVYSGGGKSDREETGGIEYIGVRSTSWTIILL